MGVEEIVKSSAHSDPTEPRRRAASRGPQPVSWTTRGTTATLSTRAGRSTWGIRPRLEHARVMKYLVYAGCTGRAPYPRRSCAVRRCRTVVSAGVAAYPTQTPITLRLRVVTFNPLLCADPVAPEEKAVVIGLLFDVSRCYCKANMCIHSGDTYRNAVVA